MFGSGYNLAPYESCDPSLHTRLYKRPPGHAQVVGRGHSGRWRGAAPVHLHVVPQVGLGGEALVAVLAAEGLLLGVDAAVADELCGHAERLPAVGALVPLGLCVDPAVVLQGHEVGELLLAGGAEVSPRLVAVLVVEQRAGVPVGPPTLVAHVGLLNLTLAPLVTAFVWGSRDQSLLLHESEVKARPPAQILGAPGAGLLGPGLRRLAVCDLHVESEAGLRGEGPLAAPAGQLTLLLVDAPVVVELRGHPEGLPAVVAAVAACFGVDAAVILEGEQVGVSLQAHGAVVDADGVGVLVVEEGAGMAVGPAALVTSVQSQTEKAGSIM